MTKLEISDMVQMKVGPSVPVATDNGGEDPLRRGGGGVVVVVCIDLVWGVSACNDLEKKELCDDCGVDGG
jgi:hypothetical protein